MPAVRPLNLSLTAFHSLSAKDSVMHTSLDQQTRLPATSRHSGLIMKPLASCPSPGPTSNTKPSRIQPHHATPRHAFIRDSNGAATANCIPVACWTPQPWTSPCCLCCLPAGPCGSPAVGRGGGLLPKLLATYHPGGFHAPKPSSAYTYLLPRCFPSHLLLVPSARGLTSRSSRPSY